jgi:hypothetical protein
MAFEIVSNCYVPITELYMEGEISGAIDYKSTF